jgi:PAS domain S-box-containing protein
VRIPELKLTGGERGSTGRRLRICLAGCKEAEEKKLRETLSEACFEPVIDTCPDAPCLEERLRALPPDLLMTAEENAPLDFPTVLEMTQRLAPHTPVIVFTANPSPEAAVRAIERGAADYIQLDREWEVAVAARRALREFEQRQRRKEAEDRLRNHINLLQLQQVVATAANEALSPQDAAQSVLDITRAYGNFILGHLFYLADEHSTRIQPIGIWSNYDDDRHGGFRMATENLDFAAKSGLASTVLETRELIWVSDIGANPHFLRGPAATSCGLRGAVMAPVAAGSETLGVIEFFSSAPIKRDEHLALVIEYVATQLGRVFERDRAERRLENRAREQMVLAELSRKAVEVVNLDSFLTAAVRRIEDVLPDCHCAVLEATGDSNGLRLRTLSDGPVDDVRDWLIPAASDADLGHAVLHNDLLKLDLRGPHPWKVPGFLEAEINTAVTASIRLRHDLFGAVIAYSPHARDFSRNETAFLRSVANVLATAAEHSTAFHQLQLLGSAVTQSQDSIMITDAVLDAPGPRILFVNPAFTQITGYRIEEVLGFSPRFLQGEKTDAEFLERMHTRLRQGRSAHGETINYRKDGSEFWVEMQVSPLRNSAGEITHFVGIQRDITERKIAEERLRESEATLGAAQRIAHLGSWFMDFKAAEFSASRLIWSEEVFRIFGYSPGGIEVTNEAFFDSVHPDDREIVREVFHKALNAHIEYQIDHRIIRPDGVHRIVHEQATALYDEVGNPIRVIGTVQDITERKQAEEEVRHWKERYDMLTRASGQIIFDWDYLGGHITYGGDSERLIGCPPENLGGTIEDWIARIHPEDHAAFERVIKLGQTGQSGDVEFRLRRNDNNYITVKGIGYPMVDATGRTTRILGSITDISNQKALEVQLRRSQKMEAFGKLAGGVAHDFNNLLTVITGYNEVVMSEMAPDDPKREYIEEIARAANRASSLTSQLLAFSRQQKMQPRVVNLNDVLRDTSKMLIRLIGEDIRMTIQAAEDLGNVKTDVGQMEQVLMNLAVNARDAMAGGGAITMSTRNATLPCENSPANLLPGEYALLDVTDTGMGMSPEVQARIFEPFFTTKAPGHGTGLGLATCYGIIKQSGGEIAVKSKVGVGTTFQIFLPRVYETQKSYDIPLGPGDLPTGTQTILVVEDELPVRAIMRSILQRLKYTVLEAANGAEAMRILMTPGGKPVELLMTDLVMPEMGGKELARRTRAMFPDMEIIFTSGYPISPTEELLPDACFLQKPFSPKALAEAVHRALS